MNVLTFASRKGGSGKSTLAAHLAAFINRSSRRCLLIDADPQGSLTLWRELRQDRDIELRTAARGFDALLRAAGQEGFDYVFIDTPPNMSNLVCEAIRAATLVIIPSRPTVFDLSAVRETAAFARERRRPYAVVINAAPVRRDDVEAPAVTEARAYLEKLHMPVWGGQISQRNLFARALAHGEGVREWDAESAAAAEIARLWAAIDKSLKVIRGAGHGGAMHRQVA